MWHHSSIDSKNKWKITFITFSSSSKWVLPHGDGKLASQQEEEKYAVASNDLKKKTFLLLSFLAIKFMNNR